jgi:hypothetical protein
LNGIFDEMDAQVRDLRAKRDSQNQALQNDLVVKINGMLRPDQRELYKQYREEREKERQRRKMQGPQGGPGGPPPGPPPPETNKARPRPWAGLPSRRGWPCTSSQTAPRGQPYRSASVSR